MEGSLERHDILSYLNCKIGLPHFWHQENKPCKSWFHQLTCQTYPKNTAQEKEQKLIFIGTD